MKKIIVDVKSALKHYNENNPDNPMNRAELAKKIGVSGQTLSNYQTGRSTKIIQPIKSISEITGIDLNKLITYKED